MHIPSLVVLLFFFLSLAAAINSRPFPSLSLHGADFEEKHQLFSSSGIVQTTSLQQSSDDISERARLASNAVAEQIYGARAKLPRLTLSGKSIPPTFDPGNIDYWQSIALLGLLGFVLTLIALVFSMFFHRIRSCGLCGGFEPSHGCFRGVTRRKPYPAWQAHSLRFFAILLTVFVLAVSIAVFYANYSLNDNVQSSKNVFKVAILRYQNQTQDVGFKFKRLATTLNDPALISNIDTAYTFQETKIETLVNVTKPFVRDASRAAKALYIATIIMFIASILIPFSIVVSGIGNWKEISMYASNYGFSMIVILMIAVTILFPLNFIIGDACVDFNNYVADPNVTRAEEPQAQDGQIQLLYSLQLMTYFVKVGFLDEVVRCATNSSFPGTADLRSTEPQITTTYIAQVNKYVSDATNRTYTFTNANLEDALQVPEIRNDVTHTTQVQRLIDILRLSQYLSSNSDCKYIVDAYLTIKEQTCVGVVRFVDLLWVLCSIVAILLSFSVLVSVLGYKRFRKRKYVIPKRQKGSKAGVHIALRDIDD